MTMKSWSEQVLKAASYDDEIGFLATSIQRFLGRIWAESF